MADEALVVRLGDDGGQALELSDALGQDQRAVRHSETRPERGPDPSDVREARVPGFEVLVEVGDVHRRAPTEIPVRPLIGRARQGLEVRDQIRPEGASLRRGEAEEELSVVGDQMGGRDACSEGKLLGQAASSGLAPTHEPLADARDREYAVHGVEHGARADGDVLERVAAEEHTHVVLLEARRHGIAREADSVEYRLAPLGVALGGLHVDRQVVREASAVTQSRKKVAEVRTAPRRPWWRGRRASRRIAGRCRPMLARAPCAPRGAPADQVRR